MRLRPDKRMKNGTEGKPRMDMYPRFFIVGVELPSESHPLPRKNASNPYKSATWISVRGAQEHSSSDCPIQRQVREAHGLLGVDPLP